MTLKMVKGKTLNSHDLQDGLWCGLCISKRNKTTDKAQQHKKGEETPELITRMNMQSKIDSEVIERGLEEYCLVLQAG